MKADVVIIHTFSLSRYHSFDSGFFVPKNHVV